MTFLELYFKHERVSLDELYERTIIMLVDISEISMIARNLPQTKRHLWKYIALIYSLTG